MKHALIFLLAFVFHNHVFSCDCDYASTKQNIERSNYVALVKVKQVASNVIRHDYKIIVEEVTLYKGKSVKEIFVFGGNRKLDASYYTSCDLGVDIDEEWLIYGTEINNQIEIGLCSNSFRYKDKDGYRGLIYGYRVKELNEINAYFKKPLIDYAIQNGRFKLFYPNGNIEYAVKYKKGLREGEAKYYFPNGKLNGIEVYKKGNLNGYKKVFVFNGHLESVAHFSNGVQTDSANQYFFLADSNKLLLRSTQFYSAQGKVLHSKKYQTSLDNPFLGGFKYHLESEWMYDTVTRVTTHIDYYSNGNKRNYYQRKDNGEYLGDEIDYNEDGYVIKILRVIKGKPNEIVYIDSKYWSNYKKDDAQNKK